MADIGSRFPSFRRVLSHRALGAAGGFVRRYRRRRRTAGILPKLGAWLRHRQSAALHLGRHCPHRIFGAAVGVIEGLKFALLGATYCLLYRAALLLLRDPAIAALAGLSPIALYHVGWDAVLGFSHSIAMIALLASFYLALLRLDRHNGWRDYLLLGRAGGLGLLAKYNFGLMALAVLIAAAASDAAYRRRDLRTARILAAGPRRRTRPLRRGPARRQGSDLRRRPSRAWRISGDGRRAQFPAAVAGYLVAAVFQRLLARWPAGA